MSTNATSPKASKPSMAKYNAAVRQCKTAAGQLNKANWIIGDAALTVATTYGQGQLQAFADDISVNYRTVLDLRFVASVYAASDRSEDVSWTVHQIFARLANRAELVAGQAWTTAEARTYVKSLNDGDKSHGSSQDGNEPDSNSQDTTPAPALSPLEAARANVARLQGELMAAMAKLAKLEAAETGTPASSAKTGTAKVAQHTVKGVPAHDTATPRTDCPECKASGIVPMPARTTPRNARNRVA